MTEAHSLLWFDFYRSWELFWPSNVTHGELRGAANDD
jgi:hypothetical protein